MSVVRLTRTQPLDGGVAEEEEQQLEKAGHPSCYGPVWTICNICLNLGKYSAEATMEISINC